MAERGYRQARTELRLLTERQFFQEVANSSGYLDPDLVKRVYNGMIDILYRELREKGSIRFPQLCDFHLTKRKGRVFKNHFMPMGKYKPDYYSLRMRPVFTVKRYFKAYTESNPDKPHDPRERMDAEGIEYKNHPKGLSRKVPPPSLL